MLPRTEFELSENMRDFSVAYDGNRLAGCGALPLLFAGHRGDPLARGGGEPQDARHRAPDRGSPRVRAKMYGLDAVFASRYVPGFFGQVGFNEVERGELPLKAWRDCLRCPKFHSCDEIAVLRVLRHQRWEQRRPFLPCWASKAAQ